MFINKLRGPAGGSVGRSSFGSPLKDALMSRASAAIPATPPQQMPPPGSPGTYGGPPIDPFMSLDANGRVPHTATSAPTLADKLAFAKTMPPGEPFKPGLGGFINNFAKTEGGIGAGGVPRAGIGVPRGQNSAMMKFYGGGY